MAWTAPRTWTDNEVPSATVMNAHVKDNLLELAAAKFTAAGDTIRATGATALARVAIGAAGAIAAVNSGATSHEWVTPEDLWWVDVDVLSGGTANTNWDTRQASSGHTYGGRLVTDSGAQNNEVSWPIVLAAGTWTFRLTHVTGSDRGIYSVRLDAVDQGTIDGYSGSGLDDQVSDVTGIVVATTGKKTFALKMATKNASSGNYYGFIQHCTWFRTA